MILWYNSPASEWLEALPLGNGRIGAMVYGGKENEIIQLSEETIWTGGPYDPNNAEALSNYPEIQALVFEGKQDEAERLALEKFMSIPLRQQKFQTVGELHLAFEEHENVTNYRRELNLNKALSTVSYSVDNVDYTREAFVSVEDQLVLLRLKASKPGKINLSATFNTPIQIHSIRSDEKDLVLNGTSGENHGLGGEVEFQARVRSYISGGTEELTSDALEISNADEAILMISIGTNYINYKDISGDPASIAKEYLDQAVNKSFEEQLGTHIDCHKKLFERVDLDLGPAPDIPTNERIASVDLDKDPHLAALVFQFGRYLLINASQPGTHPANLQGIWNNQPSPPWGGKYTVNINTEMNYWPAEVTNLPEMHQPLYRLVREVAEAGKKTARDHYGARGWVLHHNTDGWRATAPINNSNHGIWPMGGAWLLAHMWDHFDYNQDTAFLAEVYPLFKGSVQFFKDILVEDPQMGKLVIALSNSPEQGGLVAGAAMDNQILRELFDHTLMAAKILKIDTEFQDTISDLRNRLLANQIGSWGQLQEWLLDDIDDPGNTHRHLSHLYAVFPGSEITLRKTPELFDAAVKSLDSRGEEGSGWTLSWKMALRARTEDGNHAYRLLKQYCESSLSSNLFGMYTNLFQIENNFGTAAAIAEMLLQSHNNTLHLLPALPDAWNQGEVAGLKARGGYEIDLVWSEGELADARIVKLNNQPLPKIRVAGTLIEPKKDKRIKIVETDHD